MADGELRTAGRRMIANIKDGVKGGIQAEHHIVGMSALPADQRHIGRHLKRIDVGGISMAVLYNDLIGSGLMGRLADRQDLFCHLFCKGGVHRLILMGLDV